MSTEIIALLVSIGLPVAGVLAFVAYNHPEAYQKHIFGKYNVILMTIVFIMSAHNVGVSRTINKYREITGDQVNQGMVDQLNDMSLPIPIIMLIFFGLLAYNMLLVFLDDLGITRHNKNDSHKEDN